MIERLTTRYHIQIPLQMMANYLRSGYKLLGTEYLRLNNKVELKKSSKGDRFVLISPVARKYYKSPTTAVIAFLEAIQFQGEVEVLSTF